MGQSEDIGDVLLFIGPSMASDFQKSCSDKRTKFATFTLEMGSTMAILSKRSTRITLTYYACRISNLVRQSQCFHEVDASTWKATQGRFVYFLQVIDLLLEVTLLTSLQVDWTL